MSNEEKKVLKAIEKMSPGFDKFSRTRQILKNKQEEINKLLNTIDCSLLETFKTN